MTTTPMSATRAPCLRDSTLVAGAAGRHHRTIRAFSKRYSAPEECHSLRHPPFRLGRPVRVTRVAGTNEPPQGEIIRLWFAAILATYPYR